MSWKPAGAAPFPCVDDRPLITRPYCGLLCPHDLVEHFLNKDNPLRRPSKVKLKPKKVWSCWLCQDTNVEGDEKCKNCSRGKAPAWLRLVEGDYVAIGNFVKIRYQKKVFYGLVTQIDYREKQLEVYSCEETQVISKPKVRRRQSVINNVTNEQNINSEQTTGEDEEKKNEGEDENEEPSEQPAQGDNEKTTKWGNPTRRILSHSDVAKGNLSLIWSSTCNPEEDSEERDLALMFCKYLLCGNCGALTNLTNGEGVLDSESMRADRAGKLRHVLKELEEVNKSIKYLERKWREKKEGLEQLNSVQAQREDLLIERTNIEKLLAPLQLWCSTCTWEWPKKRPFQIP
mmetsp:Transcript_1510/g.2259  ORF Transcript_1510/g.2259 Transcript_1510/m.2259 type:complete len:345 (+) Transcript_1510:4480-5514(+)